MIRKKRDKKAQITIFVIIALIIIVAIALIFSIYKRSPGSLEAWQDPQAHIEGCLKQSLEKTEETLIANNGYRNVTSNYLVYYSERVPYLCNSGSFYVPCVNQEPMFIEKIRKIFQVEVEKDFASCFSSFSRDLKRRGYEIRENSSSINVEMFSEVIAVKVDKDLIISKDEKERRYTTFTAEYSSPIYKLANTARNIVNFESTLCEFNAAGWMNNNRDIQIKKFVTSDQSKVYLLRDYASGKELKFAVKTCVLPAGI